MEIENSKETRSKSIEMILCHCDSAAIRLPEPESDPCLRCMNSSCFSPEVEHRGGNTVETSSILVVAALLGFDAKTDKQAFEATHHEQRHHEIHDSTARLRSMAKDVTWT